MDPFWNWKGGMGLPQHTMGDEAWSCGLLVELEGGVDLAHSWILSRGLNLAPPYTGEEAWARHLPGAREEAKAWPPP